MKQNNLPLDCSDAVEEVSPSLDCGISKTGLVGFSLTGKEAAKDLLFWVLHLLLSRSSALVITDKGLILVLVDFLPEAFPTVDDTGPASKNISTIL